MKKGEAKKWEEFKSKVYHIQKGINYLKDHQVQITIPIELDVTGKRIQIEQVMADYSISTHNKEVLDYLVVNDLKSVLMGLYTTFKGYDTSVDTGWDTYNDEYRDGSILEEEWNWEVEDRDDLEINLEIENSVGLLNALTDKGLPTTFYLQVCLTPMSTTVEFKADELVNQENPYLEHKDVVDVLQYFLNLDTREGGHPELTNVYVKDKTKREDIKGINKEVMQNMAVVLKHEKFQNLIREGTHQEEDVSTLYLKTRGKVATLSRFFRGYNYHVNTVYDLPLTMTTHYQVEDKEVALNPVSSNWNGASLSGRYPRTLHTDNDYHKYTAFIRHHFPSLLTQEGILEGLELSVAFGDVTPKKVLNHDGGCTLLVVGSTNQGVGNAEQVLAGVKVEYSYRNTNPIDANTFYKEYQEFIKWVNKNLH